MVKVARQSSSYNPLRGRLSSSSIGQEVGGSGSYDGIVDRGRRRPAKYITYHEDAALPSISRQRMIATTQDLQRNYTAAAWAIRRHLDYVASFRFVCNTGDDRLDELIEQLVEEDSKKENFDVSGRFRRRRFVRLFEARRCVDGDVAAMKLSSGHVQAIEGDHIRTASYSTDIPTGLTITDFINGVVTDDTGRISQYMICNRDRRGGSYQFVAVLPSEHVFFHANIDRFDQSRGISPIAAALNLFRDTYEGIDYALAKMKIEQLFGLVITSSGEQSTGVTSPIEGEGVDEDEASGLYDVDLGRGAFKLELNPGDDAKMLEGSTPSTQFQEFLSSMIALALKSLDIPYSFFDESFTNFYGSRGGLMQYLKSCDAKREDIIEFLNDWLEWRLRLHIVENELKLPDGMNIQQLISFCRWVPDGVAWWDPSKEVNAACAGIAAGLNTFEKVVRETGGGSGDIYQNIRDNARVLAYAKELGYPLSVNGGGVVMETAQEQAEKASVANASN